MQVMEIDLVAGGPPVHYVVGDQNGNPLDPTNIVWNLDASLSGVSIASDATGFFFSCPAGTPGESGPSSATYTGPGAQGGSVSHSWPVNVTVAPVTDLTLFQQ